MTTLAGAMRAQYRELRRFKCGGDEEYMNHNWGRVQAGGDGAGAEIGVLSHLMDYSSTWAAPRQAAAGGRVKGRVLVSVGGIIVTQDTAERIENIYSGFL